MDGPGEAIAEPEDESAFIWDQTQLRTFSIEVGEQDLAFIDSDPAAEEYVPAAFFYEGESYPTVALRYKGSIGAFIGCTGGGFSLEPSGPRT